ncbi:uncharacterized peptidase C1-like protein F26E4.3 [Biomphalaria glabrata]|uniref:Uncharacterized peptidase C1-like protein F26E4.3 n=1 Tax=Biomphalaria glabrata TaxID=6526 RepID=A0A9W3ACZ6_BIOGL|nr:uncharacterized peptidase C1-like protein F26E4.3 [Biomphalaria glabrata]XP_013080440.2 uncharacterized peptidase C1-like protein F26E4.3 [Biomphalaria glabrata]XP_055885018.1 uncharacterized peptidase C1-like protein F26E4.3 [Biomphalaria glabrata]
MACLHARTPSALYLVYFILLLSSSRTSAFFEGWAEDLLGPWCATRPRGQDCCDSRNDDCNVPILGTECYCDVFCNATANDCCPDYFFHCHGYEWSTRPPTTTTFLPPRTTRAPLGSCYKSGIRFSQGDVTQDNCKKCTCESVGAGRHDWTCTDDVCLIRPELIQEINDGPYTWKAGNYSNLWGLTLDEGTRYRLGTFKLRADVVRMNPIRITQESLPEAFDARQKWPNMLSQITDQGNCASSWAHSTAALASDRLNIQSDGALNDVLSTQHLLSCNSDDQYACAGGSLDRAWWFLRKNGVVSDKCYPYTATQYNESVQCLIPTYIKDADCPSKIAFKRGKRFKAAPPYRIRPSEIEIMKEIMNNGPVQAILQVREDFFMYRSGVYKYSNLIRKRREPESHLKSGYHSVRIIGWGLERTPSGKDVKYWICANSWGPQWGEDGYFRIERGTDESSIESAVIGVLGTVSGDEQLRLILEANKRKRAGRGRRYLRNLKKPLRNKSEKLGKSRSRRHNINKIESYNDDDFTTGKKFHFYKAKSRKAKTRPRRKKGKNRKLILINEKKN